MTTQYRIAAISQYAFTSNDTVTNYVNAPGSLLWSGSGTIGEWTNITMSIDGTILARLDNEPESIDNKYYIYVSIDSGVTWSKQINTANRNQYNNISISPDGTNVIASSNNLVIIGNPKITDSWRKFDESNFGITTYWTAPLGISDACLVGGKNTKLWGFDGTWIESSNSPTANWIALSSQSTTGNIYAIITDLSYNRSQLIKSSDLGVFWSDISPLAISSTEDGWKLLTSSADGQKVAAWWNIGAERGLYVSSDGGVSFTKRNPTEIQYVIDNNLQFYNDLVSSIAYSPNGEMLVICSNCGIPFSPIPQVNCIYVSSNSGVTWTAQTQSSLGDQISNEPPPDGRGNWKGVAISNPTGAPCFRGNTLVKMKNGTEEEIQNIKRGDEIVTDMQNKQTNKVARVTKYLHSGKATMIEKGLIGNKREIICSDTHPFWIKKNNTDFRIRAEHITGVKSINISEFLYTIQFEDEGSYYVEGFKVDSLSPDYHRFKLAKELYFDSKKYSSRKIITKEDDPRRNKPKMVKHL